MRGSCTAENLALVDTYLAVLSGGSEMDIVPNNEILIFQILLFMKRRGKNVNHKYFYINLYFAACFGFCEHSLSGNYKCTKEDNLNTVH
jgi:hypothetical protein